VSTSGSGETLLGLIAAGDVDAAAGFYDGRAPSVREYCARLCQAELVDEATLATFVDFRGGAASAPAKTDADEILRRAARTAVAGRFDLHGTRSAVCHAIPELLTARMNGELTRGEESLARHLKRCSTCRETAGRLRAADAALTGTGPGGEPPPVHVRVAWLELVGHEASAELDGLDILGGTGAAAGNGSRPETATPARDAAAPAEAAARGPETPPPWTNDAEPSPQRPEPEPPAPQKDPGPVRVRARRGGLVGAAKRLRSSARRQQ
jgi:hypothetical protein